MGKVVSVNVSRKKGTAKEPVARIVLVKGQGVQGDAHAAPGDRQVSLLMIEHIEEARDRLKAGEGCEAAGDPVELAPGSFAENITTRGIDLLALKIGDALAAGTARLKVSKIGKECRRPCAIYYKTGDCIMPTRGIFAEVTEAGVVRPGDDIVKG
jgi:cyclic pyranopterin phosphate synthase